MPNHITYNGVELWLVKQSEEEININACEGCCIKSQITGFCDSKCVCDDDMVFKDIKSIRKEKIKEIFNK